MLHQLDLFATGIICSHCKKDPSRDPRNGNLWNGFLDQDTKQHCCWNCKGQHYFLKSRTAFKDQYSEFPVSVYQK